MTPRNRHTGTVRPDRATRPFLLLLAVVLGGLSAFGAVGLVVSGVSKLASGDSKHGAPLVVGGLIMTAFVYFAWFLWRVARRPLPGLSVRVGPQAIVMERNGSEIGKLQRPQVGLIVLHGARVQGIDRLTVWGPNQEQLGQWQTGWMKSGLRLVSLLRKNGYPFVVDDPTRAFSASIRTGHVPAWADEVVRR